MSIEVVAQAKAELLAAGENLDHACGAFKITSTAAYRLNPTADPAGWGLIHSTGNGCDANNDRYRTDTMMLQNGTVYDCLQNAESNNGLVYPAVSHDSYNIPTWSPTGPQDPANWRAPYDPGLLAPVAPPVEPPPTTNGGETNTAAILDAIMQSESRILAHTTEETDRVIARLNELRAEVIDFAEQVGKVLLFVFLRRRPDEPPA